MALARINISLPAARATPAAARRFARTVLWRSRSAWAGQLCCCAGILRERMPRLVFSCIGSYGYHVPQKVAASLSRYFFGKKEIGGIGVRTPIFGGAVCVSTVPQ